MKQQIFPNDLSLNIPVFAGQGTQAARSASTQEQALQDASTSSGAVLIASCLEAFHEELSSLSPSQCSGLDIFAKDFQTPNDLIQAFRLPRYDRHALISGISLLLIQTLRYLSVVEEFGRANASPLPFIDILKSNAASGAGILGFSSGILAASVVSTSTNLITYISRTVDAYRVAFWIGLHTHVYHMKVMEAALVGVGQWSIVFLGLSKENAEVEISQFAQSADHIPVLSVTAVLDDTCVTISGHPQDLAKFAESLPTDSVIQHPTTLETLYHSATHQHETLPSLLQDITRRGIRFPAYKDIITPIRSTRTGELLTKANSGSLVEGVASMIMTQTVRWDLVLADLANVTHQSPSRFLFIGPGTGLSRSLKSSSGSPVLLDMSLAQPTTFDYPPTAVAIVGMSVNVPGASDAGQLWTLLQDGLNTVKEIPEHRFKVSDYTSHTGKPRSMRAHTGNFIDGVAEFDNVFFKISPREARSMDPQQRLLLHSAYHALEDAGYVKDATPTFRASRFGCYIGAATSDYVQNLRDDIDIYYSTGTLRAFLSGRISHALQLGGPSVVVDTACSSSNVAMYQGVRALTHGDCDAALVGGVNVISSPDMFIGLDKGHFLSPTGQCKAFDASADGYSRSEGVVMFVLKRLQDAISENDNILGVIRGIEVNQSGLAHSITHPHAPTQAALFRQVLEKSGVNASRVNVVEAHGTGTQAGDPNEVESIREVFAAGPSRTSTNPLFITSVKGNIGHLEAASGAVATAKVLLMLKHQRIPRQISVRSLNPAFRPFHLDNTVISTREVDWKSVGPRRMALVNNFGAAGSNTALLIEEYPTPAATTASSQPLVFGLSAKSESALTEYCSKFSQWLQETSTLQLRLEDIAYTATARRQQHRFRVALCASSHQELAHKLDHATPSTVSSQPSTIAFVFSGQGGQYLGMAGDLYHSSPFFREQVDACHTILVHAGFPGVLPIILAGEQGSGLGRPKELEAFQSAVFVLQYALAQLWMSWGLTPSVIVGHSLGEYAALVIAGVISPESGLLLVATRARLMFTHCITNSTGMLAVNMSPTSLTEILASASIYRNLVVGCFNAPSDCVVSGPLSELEALKVHLDQVVRCRNVILDVPFAYHSPAMAPILDQLTDLASSLSFHPPTIAIASNVHGSLVRPGDATVFHAGYFARHCAEPVQFSESVAALSSSMGVDMWIEIGPHSSTLPMLKANPLVGADSALFPSLKKKQSAWSTLGAALTQVYRLSVVLDWRRVYEHLSGVTCQSLPNYPFAKTKFWVPFREDIPPPLSVKSSLSQDPLRGRAMIQECIQQAKEETNWVAVFETPICHLAHLIVGHSVVGFPLCPASVYVEFALEAIDASRSHLGLSSVTTHPSIRDLEFLVPLVYHHAVAKVLIMSVTWSDSRQDGLFSLSSRSGGDNGECVHAHGRFHYGIRMKTVSSFSGKQSHIQTQLTDLHSQPSTETYTKNVAYGTIFPRVVDYSAEYRSMRTIVVDRDNTQGAADVHFPSVRFNGNFLLHPVFADTLLHVAGFVANLRGSVSDAFICSKAGKLTFLSDQVTEDGAYDVFCSLRDITATSVTADAWAISATEPKNMVAQFKGMQFRRVPISFLKTSLSRASGAPIATHPPLRRFDTSGDHSMSTIVEDVSAHVSQLIAECAGVDMSVLHDEMELDAAGVDSLMFIELLAKLSQHYPSLKLQAHELTACRTVGHLTRLVSASVDASDSHSGDGSLSLSSPRTLVACEGASEPPSLIMDPPLDPKDVIASVLDLPPGDIDEDLELSFLGMDSLSSIEALALLNDQLLTPLSSDFFFTHPTLRAIRTFFAQLHPKKTSFFKVVEDDSTALENVSSILDLHRLPCPIQESTSITSLPLFLFHDGSGLTNYYRRIGSLGRSVWGIHNPNFLSGQTWNGLEDMAEEYARLVMAKATGPVLLGGWSFGGIAAYEVAQRLKHKGVHVAGLILIDSPSPVHHVPLTDDVIAAAIKHDHTSSSSLTTALIRTQFRANTELLAQYTPAALPAALPADCPPIAFLRASESFDAPGVSVPSWLSDRSNPQDAVSGWEALSHQTIQPIDISGHHFNVFHPSNIPSVSAGLVEACTHLEGQ